MKALIAMSGGVDSSVAAKLVKDMGYECIGCTMKLYEREDVDAGTACDRTCCSLDDVEDARSVAHKLDMPYYVFNFKDEFREKVIDKFVKSYEKGITPNPCIDCNRHMKFEKLFERGMVLGCDYVVTGHYVRIEKAGEKYLLKKAVDDSKDQSYVLYNMTQNHLAHTLFPLGGMKKTETRSIAEENGFINASKPDSQDICFVPGGDYAKVIERYTGKKTERGKYVDLSGNELGEHKGIIHYTVGQHKGLGISTPEPLYVYEIRPEDNTVVLCKNEELFSKDVYVKDFNWISGETPTEPVRCKAKIRYRHQEQPAVAEIDEDGYVHIVFDEPQRAVTPGQAAVLYDKDVVLGGGIIVGTKKPD